MDLRSRMFPYPILREECIDYNNSKIESDLTSSRYGNELELEINTNINNKEINEMIQAEKISYVVQIECGITFFRHLYRSYTGEFKLRIPFYSLCDKVAISTFLIIEKEIKDFSNNDFNEDYKGIKFQLEKGNIIGVGGAWSLDVNKDKDELGKLPSIFSVVMKKDLERDFEINLNQEKIKILLSEENFKNYKRLSKNRKNEALIHSLIVLPSLIYVFDELISSNGEGFDYRWKRGLGKSLEKYKINIEDMECLKKEGSIRLSQLILNMPMKRTFENLSVDEGEDE